jgi:thymidylate kinase
MAPGKSTLANLLSNIYKYPIVHLTYYNDVQKHQKQFDDASKLVGSNIILDRYIFSEIAYKNVYRPNEKGISNTDELLDGILDKPQVDIIFSIPADKERWLKNFKILEQQREEMYSSEKMGEVYDEYLKLWEKLRYNKNVFRYDLFENQIKSI